VVVLSRQSEVERLLVQMLLRGDEDLTRVNGPIVFPIFGRGRLLCSFHGDDLTAENLERVARFLGEACSCVVKEENPGVDLLMSCAWEDRLTAAGESVQANEGVKAPAPPRDESPTTARREPVAEDRETAEQVLPSRTPGWLLAAIAGATLLVLLTGVWAFRKAEAK
jgi:hypothetical protein